MSATPDCVCGSNLFIVIVMFEAIHLGVFHHRRWKMLFAAALVIGGLAFFLSLSPRIDLSTTLAHSLREGSRQ